MKPLVVRTHECPNGHKWNAEVLFGSTTNLTSEMTEWCPVCLRRSQFATPWRIQFKDRLVEIINMLDCSRDEAILTLVEHKGV